MSIHRSIPGSVLASLLAALGVAAGGADPASRTQLLKETKLTAKDGGEADGLGLAASLDGDALLAGAIGDDAPALDSGSAYVFRRGSGGWEQEAKLTPSDAEASDLFGAAVSISGDTALVGAYQDDDAGEDSGSAYVFRRDGTGWEQRAKLVASDGADFDLLGFSVAVEGDVAVVGAPLDDDEGPESGSAYVYRRDGEAWVEEAKLTASDGGVGDAFGLAVAVAGGTIVIGAFGHDSDTGAAYVFERMGETWVEAAKLTASDGEEADRFGVAVAIDGGTIAIGAPGSEAVHVFEREGEAWIEAQPLTASDPAPSTEFGFTVAVHGDVVVVGAFHADAAYVFRRTGSGWEEDRKLVAKVAGVSFGRSVATDGQVVAVGAPFDDDRAPDAGAVHVFEEAGGDNLPPVSDAGADVAAECASPDGAAVTLDGTGSADPDGNIARFEWFEDLGLPAERFLGEGETLEVTLPLGPHLIALRVTDDGGASDTDGVEAAIVDTTAPKLALRVEPAVLWPPDRRLVDVRATVEAEDACGAARVTLLSVTSSEPDDGDVRGAEAQTLDLGFQLRAERAGAGGGRSYTVRYSAEDAAGNRAVRAAMVRVPHDQGRRR